MNLRDLKYFVTLAKLKHYAKAADACFVSQPTLSTQLKKLENELGLVLIERGAKAFSLTRQGELFLDHAQNILNQAQQIKDLALSSKDISGGELQIGVIPTLGPYFLPKIIPKLKKFLPKMRVWFHEKQTHQLLDDLHSGKLDAAFMVVPCNDESMQERFLFDEKFFIALPAQHSLAKKVSLSLEDLKHETILLLEDGHCLRDQALSICHHAQLNVLDEYRATSLEMLRYMIVSGAGVSLFPELAAKAFPGIVYVPIKKSKLVRSVGLVLKKTAAQQKRIEKFFEVL